MNQELIDIMEEFFGTTQYQGEIGDWNVTDETYEDPDDEEEEGFVEKEKQLSEERQKISFI